MKVLYFGDVFGRPGREAVLQVMPQLVRDHSVDFVLINGENATHGRGILPDQADLFYERGVDGITMGNHTWDQKQIIPYIEANDHRMIRPANYSDHPKYPVPGKGTMILKSRRNPDLRLGVIQVMGRVFMDALDCPFRAADREIDELRKQGVRAIFVDFHGEASSEKVAFSWHVDGRASAVVGSHGHVQTADERVQPGGTAAITDVGMCGCFDSVIGVKKEISIRKFLTKMPARYEPAEGPGGYGAVIVDINERTGKAKQILRLRQEVVVN